VVSAFIEFQGPAGGFSLMLMESGLALNAAPRNLSSEATQSASALLCGQEPEIKCRFAI